MVVAVEKTDVVCPDGKDAVKSEVKFWMSLYFSYGRVRFMEYFIIVDIVIAAAIEIPVLNDNFNFDLSPLIKP